MNHYREIVWDAFRLINARAGQFSSLQSWRPALLLV